MYSIVISRTKVETELQSSKNQIATLEQLPLSAQEKIANFDIQIRYEVDKCKWWKSLLTLNRSNLAKFHKKLTSKELEMMEMANEIRGDWALTSVMDGEEFKNDNGYLEMCSEYKKFYEQRKNLVEAEEVIFKEDEDEVVEVEYVCSRDNWSIVERSGLGNDPRIIRQALRERAVSGSMASGAINFITGTGTKPREYKRR